MAKLTEQQQALWNELKKGRKITIINEHYLSGGTYVFADSVGKWLGRLSGELVKYRVFNNLMYALDKEMSEYLVPLSEVEINDHDC